MVNPIKEFTMYNVNGHTFIPHNIVSWLSHKIVQIVTGIIIVICIRTYATYVYAVIYNFV